MICHSALKGNVYSSLVGFFFFEKGYNANFTYSEIKIANSLYEVLIITYITVML